MIFAREQRFQEGILVKAGGEHVVGVHGKFGLDKLQKFIQSGWINTGVVNVPS